MYYDFKNKQRCVQNYVYYMLNRTLTMFEYDGLPDTIPKIDLERFIQQNGEVCIAKHNDNLYAFTAGLGGFPDVYYEPTEMIVANPALDLSKSYKIGIDCVRFRNVPCGPGNSTVMYASNQSLNSSCFLDLE